MADVNLQLVREFFELNLFHVLTNWQHESARPKSAEHGISLFVENVHAEPGAEAPFALEAADLPAIERAVVEVRAWHADRFYPSVIESSPILSQFVQEENLALPRQLFGSHDFTSILVISELPASPDIRTRSVELLQQTGIGHVLEFPVLLRGVLDKLNESANYPASQTLQTLRLLKRYRFVRNQQLEFAFPTEPPRIVEPMPTESVAIADPGEDEED